MFRIAHLLSVEPAGGLEATRHMTEKQGALRRTADPLIHHTVQAPTLIDDQMSVARS
jgi:hypothetical protein